jgi:cysteine desulfurase
MRLVYLDNNATTAVAPEAVAAMRPFLEDLYFNPSSMYGPANRVARAMAEARRDVAALVGAEPDRLFFTGCATESNNWAIFGALRARPERRHVVTSAVEHPAVREVCRALVREGVEVTEVPVDREGRLDLTAYVRALRPGQTALVTIMHANNETGVIFPIEGLSRIAKETDPGMLFHTDATQSVGKIPVDLAGGFRNVDLLSFSGHKLHAPKGVGALYIRRGAPVRPFLLGGHQEQGQRAGTENVPYIMAFGAAAQLARRHLADEEAVRARRDRLQRELAARIPMMEINGGGAPRLPNTLNLAVHFVEGEAMLFQLDAHGICASSGSACTSGSLEPSHVLTAMNVPFTARHGSIRFSLSRYTTEEEVDGVIEVFPRIVEALRRICPYWDVARNAPRADIASPREATA